MGPLPSGTVTFLFTDLEGSTRLWESHPTAMHGALARHDELLREAVAAHDGAVVKTTGDGVHAAFATAHDAVEAAIDAQRALAAEDWPETGPLRVRMGVHTGEAQHRDGDYYGTALNRAARVMSIAHGGQLVVSDATERLLSDNAASYDVLDLGEHRLRDLAEATRVYQINARGLAAAFPPLRSLDAFPGNLPLQLTTFVGRDEETAAIGKMLDTSRLVTLTGVGGVGKTRLALQVAADVLPAFPDGAWLCELAAASDDVLMYQAVADAVGARQREAMTLADSIVEYLRDREVLVVLDNCEHLLADAAWLASEILQRAPGVKVLATSREGLGVMGEQLVALASLRVPPSGADAASADASDAVRLFVDRAVARRPDFTLGPSNVSAVTEVCRRLDGMPLAIELAAARVTAMTPVEIAARLDERFRLLTGGRRSRVERHQTLRATVEWSYSLVEPTERLVFDRLGVFVGSFDAAAAEAVVTDDDVEAWDVLDALASLVEKSMVLAELADDGTTRYRLLETLRAFAREQLDGRDETDRWRRCHAAYYAEFCERVGAELGGPDELRASRRVSDEIDNLRAALSWGADAPDQRDADLALRILIGLSRSTTRSGWNLRTLCEALVPRARTSEVPGRALVLAATAGWCMIDDRLDEAADLALEALAGADDSQSNMSIGWAYYTVTSTRTRQGRAMDAFAVLQEGHDRLDSVAAPPIAHAELHGLASLLLVGAGDLEAARREAQTELDIARQTGNPSVLASALAFWGRACFHDDPDVALRAFEESIALTRAGAADGFHPIALDGAAQLRARAGDRAMALDHLRAAFAFDHAIGIRADLGMTVERAVATLATLGEDTLSALCFGVVQAETVTAFRSLAQIDRTAARVAERMGADAYRAAYDRGAALGYSEVAPTLLAELDTLVATGGQSTS
ncbi:MAG TPA: adenylate/guanylate cyclase domain-containing protein [Acidimicrobiia bacterium]